MEATEDQGTRMVIETRAISDLSFDPRNARKRTKRNLESIKASLSEFGQTKPIVVQENGVVIAGNGTLEAAQLLGWTHLAVVVWKGTITAARRYALVDNRSAELAEWDREVLADELQFLATADEDGATILSAFGFDDFLIPEDETPPEEEPRREKTEPVVTMPMDVYVKLGQLWALGDHRLLVADSMVPDNIRKLIGDEKTMCVVTDPPYAIYGSSTGGSSDITDDKIIRPFFRGVLEATIIASKPYAHFWIFCDWRSWSSWWEVARDLPTSIKNMVVWDKGSGLGSNLANSHELIAFGSVMPRRDALRADSTNKGSMNKGAGIRPTLDVNVWRVNRVMKTEDGEKRKHNAQKPVELYTRAFGLSSEEGDVVVDFFSGSGTCVIAAEMTKRRARVMEINPGYAQLTIERWEKYTGRKAELLEG